MPRSARDCATGLSPLVSSKLIAFGCATTGPVARIRRESARERVDKSWRNALLAENDVHIDRLWEVNAVLSGAKVSQPSLFVAGEDDTVVRDIYTGAFNALEKTMPGLTKKILLPRTGHWVQQECLAEVPGLMLDFLPQTIS